jgi:hypothetical protein
MEIFLSPIKAIVEFKNLFSTQLHPVSLRKDNILKLKITELGTEPPGFGFVTRLIASSSKGDLYEV